MSYIHVPIQFIYRNNVYDNPAGPGNYPLFLLLVSLLIVIVIIAIIAIRTIIKHINSKYFCFGRPRDAEFANIIVINYYYLKMMIIVITTIKHYY